jgi:hypothetical protein
MVVREYSAMHGRWTAKGAVIEGVADIIAALPKEPSPAIADPFAESSLNSAPWRMERTRTTTPTGTPARDDSTNVKPAATPGVAPRNADPNHDGVGGMECPNHPGQTCIARAQRNGLCVYTCAIDNGDTPSTPTVEPVPCWKCSGTGVREACRPTRCPGCDGAGRSTPTPPATVEPVPETPAKRDENSVETKIPAKCSKCGHEGDVWIDPGPYLVGKINEMLADAKAEEADARPAHSLCGKSSRVVTYAAWGRHHYWLCQRCNMTFVGPETTPTPTPPATKTKPGGTP